MKHHFETLGLQEGALKNKFKKPMIDLAKN